MNSFGRLKWTVHKLSLSANLLDLSLSIQDESIVTQTHQKKLNLYIYLAGSSAYPMGTLQSLIFGKLCMYQLTNTLHEDFIYLYIY